LTPRPAEGIPNNAHLATQLLIFGAPNASRTPALTFAICSPAPGFQFGAKVVISNAFDTDTIIVNIPTVVVNPNAAPRFNLDLFP